MAGVRLAVFALALMMITPARAEPVDRWQSYIVEASARFGVPAEWIERVMRAESGGRTKLNGRPIVSRAGAMGLMQLMPRTWAEMRWRLGLGNDPHAPRDNILAGTYYLRLMYDRFGYPGLFAAYNAGPARYTAYLTGRATLPRETRAYMAAVAEYRDARAAEARTGLFPMRRNRIAETHPDEAEKQIFFIRPDEDSDEFLLDRIREGWRIHSSTPSSPSRSVSAVRVPSEAELPLRAIVRNAPWTASWRTAAARSG